MCRVEISSLLKAELHADVARGGAERIDNHTDEEVEQHVLGEQLVSEENRHHKPQWLATVAVVSSLEMFCARGCKNGCKKTRCG